MGVRAGRTADRDERLARVARVVVAAERCDVVCVVALCVGAVCAAGAWYPDVCSKSTTNQ